MLLLLNKIWKFLNKKKYTIIEYPPGLGNGLSKGCITVQMYGGCYIYRYDYGYTYGKGCDHIRFHVSNGLGFNSGDGSRHGYNIGDGMGFYPYDQITKVVK